MNTNALKTGVCDFVPVLPENLSPNVSVSTLSEPFSGHHKDTVLTDILSNCFNFGQSEPS